MQGSLHGTGKFILLVEINTIMITTPDKPIVIHESLPQTLTPELLANWITENEIDHHTHVKEEPLTAEMVTEYEHRSSIASRAIDRLEAIKKQFDEVIKGGTVVIFPIEIPITSGMKVLEANRKFADTILEDNCLKQTIDLYGIPWPEKKVVIFVTIQGEEYPDHAEKMTPDQEKVFNTMFVDDATQKLKKAHKGGKGTKDDPAIIDGDMFLDKKEEFS